MIRSYRVTKTRNGQPKIILYLGGNKILEKPVASIEAGTTLGKAWEKSR